VSSRSVFGSDKGAIWKPQSAHFERSRLWRFMETNGFETLAELHARSVDDSDWFTRAAADDLEISLEGDRERVRDESVGRAFPRWFPDAKMNVAASCVDRHASNPATSGKAAIVYEGDSGQRRVMSFAELRRETDRFAAGLIDLGVRPRDRVVLFTPPIPEAAAAIMACAKVGAIIVPAFSGYGPEPLSARMNAAEAVALVTVESTTRRGKLVPMKAIADEAAAKCPTLRHVIVIGGSSSLQGGRDRCWEDLPEPALPVTPVPMNPNDPLFILFTSGTTGAPKGIVHSHVSLQLKAAIDFGYAFDLQADDTLAWITDMGWMLGPLMIVGGLHLGSTLVLIEGLPNHPEPDRIWRIVERNGATVLGIAPTAARGLRAHGGEIVSDLSTLRAFASTGEAWDEPTWRWLFANVGGGRLPIINYSGGTETGGGILCCYTIAPQSPASFSGPLLGMDVNVFDADGLATNKVGELVVLNTWVGMTHSFWRDDDRYLDAYWNRWNNVWVHGDFAAVDGDGYWHIHGRSDDTLKVGGRRVGPAEIESALVGIDGVSEVAVIGVPDPVRGQAIVGFITLKPGVTLPDEYLVESAARLLGKGMAPAALHQVETLPKTRNGKIMRRLIRSRYLSLPTGDLSALDPSTPLEAIPQISEEPSDVDSRVSQ
jgi:acetyl-CoA synthetase